MKPKKLDHIWEHIEADLGTGFQETHKELLYAAIHELPVFKAPEKVWLGVEKNIAKPTLRINWKVIMIAASILAVLFTTALYFRYAATTDVQYTRVNSSKGNLQLIADTSSEVFTELKEATCMVKPKLCLSHDFIAAEAEYKELLAMQEDILNHANIYDGDDHMEAMLLKLEQRKKMIEQELMAQINL